MASDDKITGIMKFIEEQLRSLKQNKFNGTFTIRLGLKDGGVCTTGTSVDQLHRPGQASSVFITDTMAKTKNN